MLAAAGWVAMPTDATNSIANATSFPRIKTDDAMLFARGKYSSEGCFADHRTRDLPFPQAGGWFGQLVTEPMALSQISGSGEPAPLACIRTCHNLGHICRRAGWLAVLLRR